MEAKSVAKVGSLVVVALVLGAALYFYLSHFKFNTYIVHVTFDDTKGLLRQSPVRMQGVTIGEVQSVDLDTSIRPPKPEVTLRIESKYAIPEGSEFVIYSSLLLNNSQLEIIPSKSLKILSRDGTAPIQTGSPAPGALASLSPELQDTVTKFNRSFENINGKLDKAYAKVDRILDQTQVLLKTSNKTIQTAQGLIGDPRLKSSFLTSLENLKEVTSDARVTSKKLSRDLQQLVASGKGKFDDLSKNLLDLLNKAGNTLDEANTVVAKLTEQVTDPRLQQSIQETAELARSTLAGFRQITTDIHQLLGDPQLQGNLKATVENLRQTTERGQRVVEKVDNLLGSVTGNGTGKIHTPRLPRVELIGNVSEQFDPDRLRVDLDARLHFGKRSLFDFGLYDLGQNTRLNLQAGNALTDDFTVRYGLYASKLGAGLDWTPSPGSGIRADLWDTNRPRLDVRGLFRVNSDASVWIGADSLFRRPVPLIGVQIKQ